MRIGIEPGRHEDRGHRRSTTPAGRWPAGGSRRRGTTTRDAAGGRRGRGGAGGGDRTAGDGRRRHAGGGLAGDRPGQERQPGLGETAGRSTTTWRRRSTAGALRQRRELLRRVRGQGRCGGGPTGGVRRHPRHRLRRRAGDRRGVLVGGNAVAGEWGHNPLPWPDDLERPGPECYCGARGCLEVWISGTGFEADHRRATGRDWRAAEHRPGGGRRRRVGGGRARALRGPARPGAGDRGQTCWIPEAIVAGRRPVEPGPALPYGPAADSSGGSSGEKRRRRLLRAAHGDASGVRGAAWLWPAPRRPRPAARDGRGPAERPARRPPPPGSEPGHQPDVEPARSGRLRSPRGGDRSTTGNGTEHAMTTIDMTGEVALVTGAAGNLGRACAAAFAAAGGPAGPGRTATAAIWRRCTGRRPRTGFWSNAI